MNTRSLIVCVFVLCYLSVANAWNFEETNSTTINARSAYCFYYGSNEVDISNQNTWINGTSKSGSAHVSIYSSTSPGITQLSTKLATCTPSQNNQHTCSTEVISWSYEENVQLEYIMACIECHTFGSCKMDSFVVSLSQEPSGEGYVACTTCYTPSS